MAKQKKIVSTIIIFIAGNMFVMVMSPFFSSIVYDNPITNRIELVNCIAGSLPLTTTLLTPRYAGSLPPTTTLLTTRVFAGSLPTTTTLLTTRVIAGSLPTTTSVDDKVLYYFCRPQTTLTTIVL